MIQKSPGLKLMIGLAAAGVIVGGGLLAFRSEEYLDSPLGRMKAEWRWGMLRRVTIDFDGDGRVDFVGLYPYHFRRPSADDPFAEDRERVVCDGTLDLWASYSDSGEPTALEWDRDCDGFPEVRRHGTDLGPYVREILAQSRFRGPI
jgi:hypothetical protein